MKKLMIVLVVLMVTVSAAFADRVVSADSLPQTAKDLIAQYFPGKSVMYAEADFNEYEVNLNDGTEIQFSGKGEWEEIKCYTGVPEALLNAAAVSYAKQQYPDAVIIQAEKDWRSIELKLSNRMELYFDTNGNFLGMKYDD